jgi:hypothetical protein
MRILSLFLAACTFLTSCGSDSKERDKGPYERIGMTGEWMSSCFNHEDHSHRNEAEFAGDTHTMDRATYKSHDCKDDERVTVYRMSGHSAGLNNQSDIEGWDTIRFTVASVELMIEDERVVDLYKKENRYERNDWEVDEFISIDGRSFDGKEERELTIGSVRRHTFLIQGKQLRRASYENNLALSSNDVSHVFYLQE